MQVSQPGIWIIDASGKSVFANQRMAEILGASISDIVGRHSFEWVFPEDATAAQSLFERKIAGDSSSFKFGLRRKDGTRVPVEIQGTPMHDQAGTFMGIVGTFHELTESPI